jgi:putative DNA primase/helicase
LEAEAILDTEVEMPAWLSHPAPIENPKELLAMSNGLFDMRTRRLLPHSPKFWSPNVVDFEFDPSARAPRFDQFLEEVWPCDEEARQALLELFGLCLTDETRCHKAFMFVGPPRGGRGTIGRVLRGLIGGDNFVGATFADFKGDFGLQSWIGKKVAVFSDAKLEGAWKREQSLIAERLQSITGEDQIGINQKHRDYWNGRLTARVIVFANETLKFQDDSGALAGRFITWQMKQRFEGERADRGLTEKLLAERPGIFNLAIDALDRLRARGWDFVQPASGGELGEDLRDLASPIRVFVKDRCELSAECSVLLENLYFSWREWAALHGHWAGSCEEFSKKIRAAIGVASGRPRTVNDKLNSGRKTVLYGIGLRK